MKQLRFFVASICFNSNNLFHECHDICLNTKTYLSSLSIPRSSKVYFQIMNDFSS